MDKPKAEKSGGDAGNKVRNYIALGLVALAVVLFVVWLVSGDDDSSSSSSDSGEAAIVSVDELREESAEGTPIYWAGERQGTELELSRPDAQRTYVRYLTDGAKAGDQRPNFLTIGTYESADPVAELQRQGKEDGAVLGKAPGGATVYFNSAQPQSVYVAFADVDAQIEVFDPNFKQALQLVNSGQIVPSD
ncbi:MAG TPA: hypothetical protein VFI03_07590 [Solirubrobacterales bacterium]|nr:hypothetical protein [Solirubrobacterales bacterium]